MISGAHTTQLNSASLIPLSTNTLQANIYQVIGLKAAPLGGSTFWQQLDTGQTPACGGASFETKASLDSLALSPKNF